MKKTIFSLMLAFIFIFSLAFIDINAKEIPVPESKIEAESGIIGNAERRGNDLASGGAYVGGIDNPGDGIEVTFVSVWEGEYTLEIYYTTGVDNPKHEVFINGESMGKVTFTTNTGWGGEGYYNAAYESLQIYLVKGINTIKVIKSSDEDMWVELDYLKIIPKEGATYDDENDNPNFIEAENTTPIQGAHIGQAETASNGAYMIVGEVNDGFKFTYNAFETGNYKLTVTYRAEVVPAAHEVLVGQESYGKIVYSENTGYFSDDNENEAATTSIVVPLVEGENEITFKKNIANDRWAQVDTISIELTDEEVNDFLDFPTPSFTLEENSIKIEAEEGRLLGKKTRLSINPLASNGAYLGGIDNAGDGVEFIINVAEKGIYTLEAYYMTGAPLATHELIINGSKIVDLQYEINTGWGGVDNIDFKPTGVVLELEAGDNTVKVLKGATSSNWAELDYFIITKGFIGKVPTLAENAKRIEFETGTLQGLTLIKEDYLASCGKYIYDIIEAGDGIEIVIDADVLGTYQLTVAYFKGTQNAKHDLYVNGKLVETVEYKEQATLEVADEDYPHALITVKVNLNKGENKVKFLYNDGGDVQLDFVDVLKVDDVVTDEDSGSGLLIGLVVGIVVIVLGGGAYIILRRR